MWTTAVRSLLFFLAAPGMVAGCIPLLWLRAGSQVQTGPLAWLALPLWSGGLAVLIWCFRDFLAKGKGTPAPVDPPTELVVSGLYQYVRNPMYVGVLLVILGHFLWFGFWTLLIYAGLVFLAFSAFVIFYEEPTLQQTFGAAYEAYRRHVPRWIPKLK